MTRHRLIAVTLILSLGAGLHWTFRRLSGRIDSIFPHVARETPEIPLGLSEDSEEIIAESTLSQPPQNAAPVEPAQNIPLSELSKPHGTNGPQPPQRLAVTRPIMLPKVDRPALPVTANFTIPGTIRPIVDFWKKVYAVYDNKHVILHDMEDLGIQYEVLDFTDLDRKSLSDSEKKSLKEARIKEATNRLKEILLELDRGVISSAEARRVANLFSHDNDNERFRRAASQIRTQTCLKNRFEEGLRRSGRYMPIFEQIFAGYGVPVEITRLPFVESLFRERAYSKVGAAGLWQFMPDSAKKYILVDRLVDERYDPIAATHAAARLLRHNYELLGSWPLAINAYNSGPGNLLKAISALGTRDIATIILRYRSGSYAFASRNFYPSFLAALSTYEEQEHYFGKIKKEPVMDFDLVELPATMTFPQIAFLAESGVGDLKELNPAFDPEVVAGKFSLPAGSQIRIPKDTQPRFASRFVRFHSGQIGSSFHVVQTGESLENIADTHQVSLRDLKDFNSLKDFPQKGQILQIPHPKTPLGIPSD